MYGKVEQRARKLRQARNNDGNAADEATGISAKYSSRGQGSSKVAMRADAIRRQRRSAAAGGAVAPRGVGKKPARGEEEERQAARSREKERLISRRRAEKARADREEAGRLRAEAVKREREKAACKAVELSYQRGGGGGGGASKQSSATQKRTNAASYPRGKSGESSAGRGSARGPSRNTLAKGGATQQGKKTGATKPKRLNPNGAAASASQRKATGVSAGYRKIRIGKLQPGDLEGYRREAVERERLRSNQASAGSVSRGDEGQRRRTVPPPRRTARRGARSLSSAALFLRRWGEGSLDVSNNAISSTPLKPSRSSRSGGG